MERSLQVVFLWHMHQPDYRDYSTGEYVLPWVYLHAIKDYTDMAYHLEQHPDMHAVVNFVPVLLDQLEDYVEQFTSGKIRDPLLRLLAQEDLNNLSAQERELVLNSCFRSNHHMMVAPYPAYSRLFDLFKMLEPGGTSALDYLSGQYLADLLTWYHLVWCGESVRREHDLVIRLMSKDEGYTIEDRQQLFDLIGKVIAGLIPRYRKLAESGRVEISATPHYHPLSPLLLDLNTALESAPESPMPQSIRYPGGRTRVLAHLNSALETHRERFGIKPDGVWPAEGAVSSTLLEVMSDAGCQWTASGEGVLTNSLRASGQFPIDQSQYLYRPYRLHNKPDGIRCFFRDDRLSDLIGFEYSRWHGKDAANHFVTQLETIADRSLNGETPIVSIILDGENAWEYYPYNGYYFLHELYSLLQAHPRIHPTTYREHLTSAQTGKSRSAAEGELSHVVAGSWVYGNFSTWIGSPDKNRAWDLLCVAKQSYDMVVASGRLSASELQAAERQLASCESSDWFWWFGDYNPAMAVSSFDQLFRHNLTRLYQLLGLPVPPTLSVPISHGGGKPEAGGAMRRAT